MLTDVIDATSAAAYEIGYESGSQFRREYSQLFGQVWTISMPTEAQNPCELRAPVNLDVIHVQPDRHATGSDGLAQAVQASVRPLAPVKLRVRDEPAGPYGEWQGEAPHFAAAPAA